MKATSCGCPCCQTWEEDERIRPRDSVSVPSCFAIYHVPGGHRPCHLAAGHEGEHVNGELTWTNLTSGSSWCEPVKCSSDTPSTWDNSPPTPEEIALVVGRLGRLEGLVRDLLLAEERGQGLPWQEAISKLADFIGKRTNEPSPARRAGINEPCKVCPDCGESCACLHPASPARRECVIAPIGTDDRCQCCLAHDKPR